MVTVSDLSRWARSVRRSPLLRERAGLWNFIRPPYYRIMERWGRRHPSTVEVDGLCLRLHPLTLRVDWRTYEPESRQALRDILKPGDVVFDVGAHIGFYTLLSLAWTAPNGRVVAYEPLPSTQRYLKLHLSWNGGAERTILRQVCCSASNGVRTFYHAPEEGRPDGTNGLVPLEGYVHSSVRARTLDSEVAELGLIPSLIKMDVEGAEWEVLQGAVHTLERHKPRLLLSLHPLALPQMGTTPGKILEWLTRLGYRHRVLAHDHELHVLAEPA